MKQKQLLHSISKDVFILILDFIPFYIACSQLRNVCNFFNNIYLYKFKFFIKQLFILEEKENKPWIKERYKNNIEKIILKVNGTIYIEVEKKTSFGDNGYEDIIFPIHQNILKYWFISNYTDFNQKLIIIVQDIFFNIFEIKFYYDKHQNKIQCTKAEFKVSLKSSIKNIKTFDSYYICLLNNGNILILNKLKHNIIAHRNDNCFLFMNEDFFIDIEFITWIKQKEQKEKEFNLVVKKQYELDPIIIKSKRVKQICKNFLLTENDIVFRLDDKHSTYIHNFRLWIKKKIVQMMLPDEDDTYLYHVPQYGGYMEEVLLVFLDIEGNLYNYAIEQDFFERLNFVSVPVFRILHYKSVDCLIVQNKLNGSYLYINLRDKIII